MCVTFRLVFSHHFPHLFTFILLSRHGALTVNVEPESTDSTTQVLHSFLQMCSQWMDTKN